jgi:hypothetical protein
MDFVFMVEILVLKPVILDGQFTSRSIVNDAPMFPFWFVMNSKFLESVAVAVAVHT